MKADLSTPLSERLGLAHPIFVGGMMWLSDPAFVAAVGRAGAIGFLTSRSYATEADFVQGLERCHELADGAPWGVNLTFSRHADNKPVLACADLALSFGVRIFETAGLPPDTRVLARVQQAGGLVIHKCTTLRHARSAERKGVDVVALVGMEEGGHPGSNALPTSLLGALAAHELTIPYLLGGGIGHGRQLISALALGAEGVVMGSRFLACDEIWAHSRYKAAIVAAQADETMTVLGSVGRTWRVLANDMARRIAEMEARGVCDHGAYAPWIAGERTRDLSYVKGRWEEGLLSAGPAIGFVRERQCVRDTISTLMREAGDALSGLCAVTSYAESDNDDLESD